MATKVTLILGGVGTTVVLLMAIFGYLVNMANTNTALTVKLDNLERRTTNLELAVSRIDQQTRQR